MGSRFGWLALALLLAIPVHAQTTASVFDEPEPTLRPAPPNSSTMPLPDNWRVIDLALSPIGPDVVVLAQKPEGKQALIRWSIGATKPQTPIPLPTKLVLTSLVWHPKGTQLFATSGRQILAWDPARLQAAPKKIWQGPHPLSHLTIGPRPFTPMLGRQKTGYRLFFAETPASKKPNIGTVDEMGLGYYPVTAAKPTPVSEDDRAISPTTLAMAMARPLGFHPAGDRLLLQDGRGCPQITAYNKDAWTQPQSLPERCPNHVSIAPNGIVRFAWTTGQAGIELRDLVRKTSQITLTNLRFLLPPRATADGRGVVGVIKGSAGQPMLAYQPLDLPLADVTNAWQFLERPEDLHRFVRHGGLFRPTDYDQLFQLYDSESYVCGIFDAGTPSRPYLVTTDALWEVYGVAYQGILIAAERDRAIPAFTRMVRGAAQDLALRQPSHRVTQAFKAAASLINDQPDAEAQQWLKDPDAAPRGHYQATPTLRRYFTALRRLSLLELNEADFHILRELPLPVLAEAQTWLSGYQPLLAPSRRPVAWNKDAPQADFAEAPGKLGLFPLAWGWDNEAMDRAIHHRDRPMAGPKGPRLLPSGLDVAMVLGNPLAEHLLDANGAFADFPTLRERLSQARREAASQSARPDTLYDRWLQALATQWARDASAPIAGPLYDTKRLQTGLAAWATLRHATVLVNDRAGAECGEAGFETLILPPPRGYVEPDPDSFQAIADLFAATADQVRQLWPKDAPLHAAALRRLEQSRQHALAFAEMATKERRGEALTPEDYTAILYAGRAAEHNFLVFFSLTSPDNALSNPDPMMKIADVVGTSQTGWLHAAVGRPLEWNVIVPAFGRRSIVKGPVYAYHELIAATPIDDAGWRQRLNTVQHPDWLRPFLSPDRLSCPIARPE